MDFTEEKIKGKRIFTCGIISVNSKVVVGYSQGTKCNTELALKAITQAIENHGIPDMIMTDRGAQFTSREFRVIMDDLFIIHSMSRPHKPIDNRFIETFWKSMKVELGKLDLLTEETYRIVEDSYIYNYINLRPHSSLGSRRPSAA